ncbi:hypothetical protein JOF56_000518 [Kibdelosporangium banguiense]|uniref:Lipoprotein n=1 Tax=Kibdelosporangium banguiense TaxID=1365924 RepID=A0ABS4T6X6_9PSEU|nr:hypothetical protein [Kibdelosporangium banguiense]MBP2320133.1 hypothetical protein [Kibdelosporangium banguiense]
MLVTSRPALSRVRLMAPLFAAAIAVLAACGSPSSGAPSSGSGAGGTAKETKAPIKKTLTETDFQGLCAGAPQAAATAYDKTKAGIHPVLGFGSKPYDSDAEKLSPLDIPEGFTVKWDKDKNVYTEIQLVVCAKRTTDTVVKKCDGYKKDGKPTGQVLNLHSTTYEVKLYTASTGDVIATKNIDAPGKDCPSVALSDQTDEYEEVDEQVVAFIQPFVKTT